MQKEFLKSCEGFLRAALTVHGRCGHVVRDFESEAKTR
jgi:hypothetical protein